MTQPYVGEIRYFPYLRVPEGWQRCDGTALSIAGNETLYTVIGTVYGGDGVNTFAVPNLQGRVAVGSGQSTASTSYVPGQVSGQETVTLSTPQIPAHAHYLEASVTAGITNNPSNATFAGAPEGNGIYFQPTTVTLLPLAQNAAGPAGSSQPHDNCAPTIAIWAFIATVGIFPSQN